MREGKHPLFKDGSVGGHQVDILGCRGHGARAEDNKVLLQMIGQDLAIDLVALAKLLGGVHVHSWQQIPGHGPLHEAPELEQRGNVGQA